MKSLFKDSDSSPSPDVVLSPELAKAETVGIAAFGFKLGWKFFVGLNTGADALKDCSLEPDLFDELAMDISALLMSRIDWLVLSKV